MHNSTVVLNSFSSPSLHASKEEQSQSYKTRHSSEEGLYRLGSYFLALNALTLVLTVVPVIANLPEFYRPYKEWYGVNDILRLLEPFMAFPFQLAILLHSGIAGGFGYRKKSTICVLVFTLAISLYQQGAGFHSASNMFKHSIETAIDSLPPSTLLLEIKSWIRDTWQHLISHYMYASGGIILSFLYAYLYHDYEFVAGFTTSRRVSIVWWASTVLYGLIIGLVAIEFPSGPIVALFLIFIFAGAIGGYICKQGRKAWMPIGSRPVLHYYFMSHGIALIIVIIWVIYARGFKNREDAGIKV